MRWFVAALGFTAVIAAADPAVDPVKDINAETTAFMAWLQRDWPNQLYHSNDPEHLLVGALLARRSNQGAHSAADFFTRALAGDPDNTLILYDAADFCLLEPRSLICNEAHLQRLAELDAANGAVWAMRSWERYLANDHSAALWHLRRAATAEVYDEYFLRHMTLFDQVLQAYRPASPAEHYVQTIGLAAGIATAGYRMIAPCRERAAGDAEWRHQCRALGLAMGRRGRTEMAVAIGIAFQIAMLKLADEPEALAAAEDRQTRRRKVLSDQTAAMESLPTDDPFWHEFFSTFVNEGEKAAHELAMQWSAEQSLSVTND